MENGYSLADISAATGGGMFGGNEGIWLILLIVLLFGGGFGYANRQGEFGQYATAASQNEILLGQKFDALSRQINQVGDGLCSSTYALNNAISEGVASVNGNVTAEGRAIQTQLSNCCCENLRNTDSIRFDMANYHSDTNAVVTAQTQKILDAMAQSKIDTLQAQVNELKTQNMFCGVPRINPYMYGVSPYNTCNCQNI